MIEIKLQLLKHYYDENHTINDIKQNYIVIVDNTEYKLGQFINDLRKKHKLYLENPDKVSDLNKERFKYLEELGIDWNPKETEWLEKYNLLKEYKDEYGDIDVPYEYVVNDISLGVFVANQRVLKRRYKNPSKELERHFKLLEDLGIEWNPQESDWNRKYNACKKFYEENKHLNVGESLIYDDIDIGVFITNQRSVYQKYKKGNLERNNTDNLEKHIKLLEDIGIIWYPNESKWHGIQDELIKYKEEHGNIDVPVNFYVKINNEDFALGMYISDSRELYRKNINNDNISNQLKERFKFLDKLGITWNPNYEYFMTRYNLLKEYKKVYGNIDIIGSYKVDYNGETINLGRFLNKQRELYRKHEKDNFKNCNDEIKEHFKLLEDLGIKWNPNKDEWMRQYNLLLNYYKEFGNIDIPLSYKVNINGEVIKLGQIARNQKEALTKRKKEIEKGTAPVEIMLRYNLLKEIGFSFSKEIVLFNYEGVDYNKKDLCNKLNISIQTFDRYLKIFDGDYHKAIRVSELIRDVYKEKKELRKDKPTLDNMLESFDIDVVELDNYLNKDKIKTTPKRSNRVLYKGNTTLRKYCIDHGYNYGVVSYALKAKTNNLIDEDLDKVIDRVLIDYNKKGTNKAPTWIYSKYGNELLLRHFLISLKLDYDYIIRDMSKNAITLEEAIRNNCFNYVSIPNKHDYLEGIFNIIVDKYNKLEEDINTSYETKLEVLDDYINYLSIKYKLEKDELNTLKESLNKYKYSINKYHIYEVGYSKKEEEKLELIHKYGLNDQEIEESFFVDINYSNHSLIGKESDEYKRRKSIKKLVNIWNDLNEEERLTEIKDNNLKYPEDYNLITILRNKINHLIKMNTKTRLL